MTLPQDEALRAFATRIHSAARTKLLFLSHAATQMSRPDRMITAQEVRSVVLRGEIIEDTEDARGYSCLILVCAPKDDYLAVITAYLPERQEWSPDFRTRRQT